MNSGAVNELRLESSVLGLWNEFLGSFFDGQAHAVGSNPEVLFPKAELRFQGIGHSQPLNGAGISLVWMRANRTEYKWELVEDLGNAGQTADSTGITADDGRVTADVGPGSRMQQVAYARANWMFWVRVEMAAAVDGKNSQKRAMETAELLFGVLQNSAATRALAQKGIHRLRPENPQFVAGDGSYVLKVINCTGMLRYPVRNQS